jgi:hypothetical protein
MTNSLIPLCRGTVKWNHSRVPPNITIVQTKLCYIKYGDGQEVISKVTQQCLSMVVHNVNGGQEYPKHMKPQHILML